MRPRESQFSIVLCGLVLFILSGCTAHGLPADQTPVQLDVVSKPAPTLTPAVYAILRVPNGNLRSGPGTSFPVVTVIAKGDTYSIIGRDEEGTWWQVCCVPDPADETGETPMAAWVATSIVDTEGEITKIAGQVAQLDLGEPLFADDFSARWKVAYRCDSDRCEVAQCTGEANAQVSNVLHNIWLEIDRQVTWPDKCGDHTLGRFQVHRYTGQDRYIGENAAFFERNWVGANPGKTTKTIPLADGQVVHAWCTGPQSNERQEKENWTIIYDGEACYDIQTGLMLTLSYARRWLFTGDANGRRYERAFFGDTEHYDFELVYTNAQLSSVK